MLQNCQLLPILTDINFDVKELFDLGYSEYKFLVGLDFEASS
jgi:hypothetical protein